MKDKKPQSPFVGKFIAFCDKEAERITQELIADLENGESQQNLKFSDGDARFMAAALSDELAHFFWHAVKAHTDDPDGLKRFNRRMACVAIQVLIVVGTAAMGAYLMSRSDCGKVVAHEMGKGLAGGIVGGLVVGAFLALKKIGAA